MNNILENIKIKLNQVNTETWSDAEPQIKEIQKTWEANPQTQKDYTDLDVLIRDINENNFIHKIQNIINKIRVHCNNEISENARKELLDRNTFTPDNPYKI